MKKELHMLTDQFDKYKAEYSNKKTTPQRKSELVTLMQTNLKMRCEKGCTSYKCLEGKSYSLESDVVNDLYAIDGALRASVTKNQMTEFGNNARSNAQKQNKYGPNNPYPNF